MRRLRPWQFGVCLTAAALVWLCALRASIPLGASRAARPLTPHGHVLAELAPALTIPPPAPAPPTATSAELAARRAQCRRPAIRAAGRFAFHGRTPLVLDRAWRRARQPFLTEDALVDASDFTEESLPSSNQLGEHLRGRRGSCAVVGNAASLLGSRFGARIDAYDQVFRVHPAVTRGYSEDVGRRTSASFFRGLRSHIAAFDRLTWSQPEGKQAIGLVVAATSLDVHVFLQTVHNRTLLAQKRAGAPKGKYPPLLPLRLLSDSVYARAVFELCSHSRRGQMWPHARAAAMRPTTTFMAVAFALQVA